MSEENNMSKRKAAPAEPEQEQAPPASAPVPEVLRFAHHTGPEWVGFAGRNWRRGVAQEVTRAELPAMTRRAGWVVFGFKREGK